MKFYRGIVVDNADETLSGRVKVRIFELHGLPSDTELLDGTPSPDLSSIEDDKLPWAEVMQPIDFSGYSKIDKECPESFAASIDGAGGKSGKATIEYAEKFPGTGYNRIIEIGTWVYCVLDNDNPNYPIVIGTMASQGEYTKSKAHRVYDSTSGHYEEYNDTTGNIIIHNANASELVIGKDSMQLNSSNKLQVYSKESIATHTDGTRKDFIKGDSAQTIQGSATQKITKSQSTEAQEITAKAQTNITAEAQSQLSLKGTSQATLESSGTTTIKGSIIMIG